MNIQAAVESIKILQKNTAPVVVGIEGFGGSGKTTLAQKLCDALSSAYVINIDDFILKEKLTEPSWDKGAFDRARLERQVLAPISKGLPAKYEKLIWESNSLSQPVTVPAVDYLIVEGISSYHPNIAHYYDYKIWVDTPLQVSNERGHARDGSNENAKFWDLWTANDLAYQEKHHPELTADFVIDNSSEVQNG